MRPAFSESVVTRCEGAGDLEGERFRTLSRRLMAPTILILLSVLALGCAARLDTDLEVAAGTDRAFAHTVRTTATPDALWAVWTDVAGWPAWDVELDSAALRGAFVDGATGRLVPKRGPAARFVLEDVEPGRAYTLVTRLPMGALRVRRTWDDLEDDIAVTHAVTFEGVGGRLLAGRLGPGFRRALPVALRRLCEIAEARS